MTSHLNVTVSLLPDFRGVIDWYQEPRGRPGFYAEEFRDSNLEFGEDPQEEVEEDPEGEPEEESEEALEMEVNDEAYWDEEMNEPELIFPIEGAAREEARVEKIRLKRELEASEISNTLIRMRRKRDESELYRLRPWSYDFYDEMVQAGFVGERPSEAINVLAVFKESQPPKPQGPPNCSQ
nr:hypothetical protein [Tanacetum cinerariifolium]